MSRMMSPYHAPDHYTFEMPERPAICQTKKYRRTGRAVGMSLEQAKALLFYFALLYFHIYILLLIVFKSVTV
jgi:hypothetical protein